MSKVLAAPAGSLVCPTGARKGWYWRHLNDVAEFASTFVLFPSIDLNRLVRAGAVPEADDEAYVVLYTAANNPIMFGCYMAGGIQFPTDRIEGLSMPADQVRDYFAKEIRFLRENIDLLLGNSSAAP